MQQGPNELKDSRLKQLLTDMQSATEVDTTFGGSFPPTARASPSPVHMVRERKSCTTWRSTADWVSAERR